MRLGLVFRKARFFIITLFVCFAPCFFGGTVDYLWFRHSGRFISGDALPVTLAAWSDAFQEHHRTLVWMDRMSQSAQMKNEMRLWRTRVLKNLALNLFLSGEFDSAVRQYDALLEIQQLDYMGGIYRGISLQKLNRLDDASAQFFNSIQLFPDRQDAYLAAGHLFLLTGDKPRAEIMYRDAIKRAPLLGFVRIDIGDAWWTQGDYQRARQYYSEAEKLDSREIQSILRMIRVAIILDRDSDAVKRWLNAAESIIPESICVDLRRITAGDLELVWTEAMQQELMSACGSEDNRMSLPTKILFTFQNTNWRGCGKRE